ncbi:uncharacterized protein DUF3107 [Propionicimonas paludicola]|uniref:Uncharacterized protein DUF3107 n=1 Tax=Propionicimonas paludicola TaxID=185243 RepID=A0A2A9CS30_9ACTN|nr:DUF3107 domain-containing protein [Propionicimonas paludicola]PFG16895.1 uncharacterized protein DUF3107 [Propionicimonas paludicola]
MEIKIGIRQVARELTVETDASAADVEADLKAALTEGTVLALSDEKGRRILVPAAQIAYLDLGQEKARPVGFGSL